jgi:hypothetical protein
MVRGGDVKDVDEVVCSRVWNSIWMVWQGRRVTRQDGEESASTCRAQRGQARKWARPNYGQYYSSASCLMAESEWCSAVNRCSGLIG